MSLDRFRALTQDLHYPFFTFEVGIDGIKLDALEAVPYVGNDLIYWLRVGNPQGRCNTTNAPAPWWGRKFRLSPHMTDGEVVWTAFMAVLTAIEHEVREQFTYKGAAVANSHVDIDKLVALHKDASALAHRAGPLCKQHPTSSSEDSTL